MYRLPVAVRCVLVHPRTPALALVRHESRLEHTDEGVTLFLPDGKLVYGLLYVTNYKVVFQVRTSGLDGGGVGWGG